MQLSRAAATLLAVEKNDDLVMEEKDQVFWAWWHGMVTVDDATVLLFHHLSSLALPTAFHC